MTQPTQAPRRIFGNFEILAQVGKGGMAEVYRSKVLSGPREGQTVAIKRLLPELAKDPEYVDLFTSEADLARMLDHPNIVRTYEVGVVKDVYYIVMEFIDGRDLGQVVRRCKQNKILLPIDFAVYLGKVLLDALAYAHAAKSPAGRPLDIVHCDISPSNLFVSRTGDIKLGDFGVARAKAGTPDQVGISGKPHYVSPEMIQGSVTPEADLWAANVTLYELLTLDRPFKGTTPPDIFQAIHDREWRRVKEIRPDVSDDLSAVLERGFAPDPAYRYQNAQEFSDALTPHFNDMLGNNLAIAAVVRGLFGATAS
ncbi:MAG: serine/threonine protein kinase [Myxococcaceae bacterium]